MEDAKAIVQQLIAAWSALDRSAFARLVHPSLHEEDLPHFDEIAGAFSDLHVTVEAMIGEGDDVAARLLVTATHDRGSFAGLSRPARRSRGARFVSTASGLARWWRRGRCRIVSACFSSLGSCRRSMRWCIGRRTSLASSCGR